MSAVPYSCQDISDEDVAAVSEVLRSEYLTQGPAITAFEAMFATRHMVTHAIAVANATAGLHLACLALGVGPNSRIWTSPNSFIASANCARYCGATVDFVDIDPVTKNISIPALERKLQIADSQGSLPHVVIPVDFAGLPCDLAEIRHLADRYGFSILEDASHATGASYLDRPVGSSYADLTVFSFHAVKVITSAEGGMVTTQCDLLAKRVRLLRSHGMTRDTSEMIGGSEGGWYYQQVDLGFNYRLTDMQAALGLSQLRRLETMHAKRLNLADRYDDCLSGLAVRRPARLPDRRSSWHLYVIELDDPARRRATFEMLREQGIGVNVHYIPIHTQPYYRRLGFRTGDFPNAERYYSGALSIPLHPRLTEEQQNHVTETLYKALA